MPAVDANCLGSAQADARASSDRAEDTLVPTPDVTAWFSAAAAQGDSRCEVPAPRGLTGPARAPCHHRQSRIGPLTRPQNPPKRRQAFLYAGAALWPIPIVRARQAAVGQ